GAAARDRLAREHGSTQSLGGALRSRRHYRLAAGSERSRPMTRTRAYLVVISLFLLGVMVGILATHAFYAHRVHRPGGLVELAMGVLAADLRRSLDLDAQQQAEVDLILAD